MQRDAAPFVLKPQPQPPPAPEPKKPQPSRDDTATSPFSVTVGQVYDGPMDLLLDLIRRQNIDIYDIPMGTITAQFLEYCHHLKNTDVDAAGEFVYTASLLIHIKSKMLLPRDPSDVTGTADDDPRRELVERLLEHERFKAAAQMLAPEAAGRGRHLDQSRHAASSAATPAPNARSPPIPSTWCESFRTFWSACARARCSMWTRSRLRLAP